MGIGRFGLLLAITNDDSIDGVICNDSLQRNIADAYDSVKCSRRG